jgi:hypothetical protein
MFGTGSEYAWNTHLVIRGGWGGGGGGYGGQTGWSFLCVYFQEAGMFVFLKKVEPSFHSYFNFTFSKIILSPMFTPYCGSIYCNSQHSPCLSTGKKTHTSYWDCIQIRTWCMWPLPELPITNFNLTKFKNKDFSLRGIWQQYEFCDGSSNPKLDFCFAFAEIFILKVDSTHI